MPKVRTFNLAGPTFQGEFAPLFHYGAKIF